MKRLTLLLFLFLALTLPACAETIEARAQTQAQKDIQSGKPEYRIYGEPSSREDILADILKTKYGVVLHRVAGCIVNEDIRKDAAAYNATVAAHLKKMHQADVFAAAEAEFMERWKREMEAPVKDSVPENPEKGKSR